jgi:hypothetical protein
VNADYVTRRDSRERPALKFEVAMSEQTDRQQIAGLKLEVKALKKTLGHLIVWMVQSSVSPIRQDEASTLLNWLDGHD